MSTLLLKISGMSCGNCVKHVTQALQEVSGVEQVDVDLAKGEASIKGNVTDPKPLISALAEEGYPAEVI